MENFDTNRIKMESIDSQSVWNNDINTIYIKEEPFEFDEVVININPEVKKEIFYDDNQEDSSNNLIDSEHKPVQYIKEEIQPELGFSTEDIYGSKNILDSYRNLFENKYFLLKLVRIQRKDKQYLDSKRFSESLDLIKHLQTHFRENAHNCKVCKKNFSSKSHLTIHLRVHSEDKLYHCDLCKKTYARNSNFNKHLRSHSEAKCYRCNICKKLFSRNSNLIRHSRIHAGDKRYNCDICKKSFSQNSELIKHSRIHSGDKPYHCDICKKAFAHRSNLTLHSRIHSREKPYRCDICAKSFSCKSNLTRHSRTHSGKDTLSTKYLLNDLI